MKSRKHETLWRRSSIRGITAGLALLLGNFSLVAAAQTTDQDCPDEKARDCDNNCRSEAFIQHGGTGRCDDGTPPPWGGEGTNLACDQHNYDNGECASLAPPRQFQPRRPMRCHI